MEQGSITKPKYMLIREQLKKAIDDGIYNSENCLPSERELSAIYSASRITIRKAINELENEGLIYTIKGKGSFVSGNKISQQLGHLASFSDDMVSRGLKPSSKILAIEVIPATKLIAENLNLRYAEEVIMLKRLRLANKEPMAIETAYLPIKYKSVIFENAKDNMSLYELAKTHCNITLHRASQSFEVSKLENWESYLLEGDTDGFCIYIQRRTYDQNNNVFEFVESKYRSKFKFYIELSL